MRGARSTKCTVDGTLFDSIAEACFYCWCKEAKELGVLESFECQPEYHLTDTVHWQEEVQLKTKTKQVQRTLLQASHYTADYRVESAAPIPGLHSQWPGTSLKRYVVDVKGAHQPPGSAAKFSLTQKVLVALRGVFVNKVVVAYDRKKYSAKKAATGFFAMNGLPSRLPDECYQKRKLPDGSRPYYAVWERMFSGLPTIEEAHKL